MAVFGIVLGLIGAAVGIVFGALGGLVGIAWGLLGGALGLLPHLFPVVLITLGIIWLVRGPSSKDVTGASAVRSNAAPPQGPCNPR